MALNEFLDWFRQAPRPGFSKATVSAWRASLESRGLGSSSIIIRMSAIRKLAGEAADNGLLACCVIGGWWMGMLFRRSASISDWQTTPVSEGQSHGLWHRSKCYSIDSLHIGTSHLCKRTRASRRSPK
jgi:hypothetical protein